jgi:hypothetical protein
MTDHNTLDVFHRCWHPYFLLAIALSIARPKRLSANKRMCRRACTGADCADFWQPAPFMPISHALRYELDQLVSADAGAHGVIQTAPIDWAARSAADDHRVAGYLDRKLRSRAPQLQSIAPTDVLLQALLADMYAAV